MNARERQEAVYRAEAVLVGQGRRWADVRGAKAYADELAHDERILERWATLGDVEVQRLRSSKWDGVASARSGLVRLKALEERVLLHEMAHVATPGTGHGPEFIGAFCELVRLRMGFFAYTDLCRALAAEGCFE